MLLYLGGPHRVVLGPLHLSGIVFYSGQASLPINGVIRGNWIPSQGIQYWILLDSILYCGCQYWQPQGAWQPKSCALLRALQGLLSLASCQQPLPASGSPLPAPAPPPAPALIPAVTFPAHSTDPRLHTFLIPYMFLLKCQFLATFAKRST